jgi:hypothetical protein
MLPRCLPEGIMDGGDLNLADSGESTAEGNGENPPIEDELVRFF